MNRRHKALSSSDSSLVFHPDFPSNSKLGGKIFRSSESIHFRFPLDLLKSTFFSNLEDIFPAPGDTPAERIIPLDSSPTKAVHLVFSLLLPSNGKSAKRSNVNWFMWPLLKYCMMHYAWQICTTLYRSRQYWNTIILTISLCFSLLLL
jgi:hypothetical protein